MAEGDAVTVCVRVRPFIHREQGEKVTVWREDNNTICQVDGTRSFNFDRVFNSLETTSQVYQDAAVPIISSALQGYNGTIFAYGQTSSGKTYTMMGTPNSLGIIPLAVQEIFRLIQDIPNREFLLRVSYLEIYNETVTDLLCDDRKKKPLEVREDINRNVYVAELTEELVMVPEHVMQWIKKGEKNRHYGATKMNDHSSRSHTIFRMIVESRERNEPGTSENCDGAVMVSHLNLVDLAGSERASQTGAEGVRLIEGCNINRSLFILGQVIKKLSDGQAGGFLNYRDSKLTRILQNSLGGNTKTVIICTITPVSFDETLSTLQFASTAKHVRNTPHVNEVLDDQALLKRYRKEIVGLKKQLEELEASSESKTQAKEERSQLLAEIEQLQKEREERICNLTKIVVACSQESQEEQKVKRKRRVTWAPGKLHDSLRAVGVSSSDMGSKLTASFPKRIKVSKISPLSEIDDSICTEFSDFEDVSHAFDELSQDADWSFANSVTYKPKDLSQSSIDFSSKSTSALTNDSSLKKSKELEQKVVELENKLNTLTKEYELEVGKRESFEKEASDLKQQLQAKDEKPELEISCLRDKIETVAEESLETPEKLAPLDINKEMDRARSFDTDGGSLTLPGWIPMVGSGTEMAKYNDQSYLIESLQICEALMAEKQNAHDELAVMQNRLDHVVAENENLRKEMAHLEKCLHEKQETNEFELLEQEAQKEHEAQLIHENSNLKKLIENSEVYNQELENELENKSKLLREQEKQIAELKREFEMLQRKTSCSDLSTSMGNGEKLCEEVLQMKQSFNDAETVTRDAQKEAAFLRSENLELKEKMVKLSIHCEKREKDALGYEKQLETEKSNYKRMQADMQKELQYAFSEINQLNGLMAGKVPKDLLSCVELDKKVSDYAKQLASVLEEKKVLEQEVASLVEYKSLSSEVEHLKDQVQKASEELISLKSEKDQSASIINDQQQKLVEQSEQIEKLTGEAMSEHTKCQQAEQQYAELKMLHESLEERCALIAEELNKKDVDVECSVKEMDKLKHAVLSLSVSQPENMEASHKLQKLQEELKLVAQHRDELIVKVGNVEAERDDIKQDLNENIELSIEMQDELRTAQEELKQQKQLAADLRKQLDDCTGDILAQTESQRNLLEQVSFSIFIDHFFTQEELSALDELKVKTELLESLSTQMEEVKVLGLQEELLEKSTEYQQDKNLLSCEIEGLMKETQSSPESLEKENLAAQRQLLDLQQQMEIIVQERDHLKNTQQGRISEVDQESQTENNDQAFHIEDLEQRASQCNHGDLVDSNLVLNNDLELLKMNLKNSEAQLEILRNEKSNDEEKRNQLQHQVEFVTEELEQLKVAQQCLVSERDQLKEELEKNVEKIANYSSRAKEWDYSQVITSRQQSNHPYSIVIKLVSLPFPFYQFSSVEHKLQETVLLLRESNNEREILEKSKQELVLELEHLHNDIKNKESALAEFEKERSEANQEILALTVQLKTMSEERDQMTHTREELQKQVTEEVGKTTKISLEVVQGRVELPVLAIHHWLEKRTYLGTRFGLT
ncbi:Belongs to the TRAFAC class myosin-kinesin ATPase superfamily. Kinesin family [Pristimantis euphronides]